MKKRATKVSRAAIVIEPPHQKSSTVRNTFWYIGVSMLLLGFFLLTYYERDYLLMAVVVAAGIAIFRLSRLQVEHKKVELTDATIKWGKEKFNYHDFKSFWVGIHQDHYEVYLDRLNFRPTISFAVPDGQIEAVLERLSDELPFHAHKNVPLPDRVSKFLRL